MSRAEGEAPLRALVRATARWRRLVRELGGGGDGRALRAELRRCGRRARGLASGCGSGLAAGLRERPDERPELRRLWAVLAACLDALEADAARALQLERAFPPDANLVRTGLPAAPPPRGPAAAPEGLEAESQRLADTRRELELKTFNSLRKPT
uniref:Regulator of G protein signaling 9 binding protein n=1 Tax=Ornithorhynchus anatinus TaxID=9258 RepID=A0A6I8N3I7_ORNAN